MYNPLVIADYRASDIIQIYGRHNGREAGFIKGLEEFGGPIFS